MTPPQAPLAHPLEALLTRSAQTLEAQRILTICNACRYCEGFCAVFPAMTRRLDFAQHDVHYLANLCHQCGACYHACQYAPPHEFAVNVPQTLATVRLETYTQYAWPAALAGAYRSQGVATAVALCAVFSLCFICAALLGGGHAGAQGGSWFASLWPVNGLSANFYAVFAHNSLALLFGASMGFSLLAMFIALRRYWMAVSPDIASASAPATSPHKPSPSNTHPSIHPTVNGSDTGTGPRDWWQAVKHATTLKYLDGGHGDGCHEADERYTHARRHAHHALAGGFMLCFAATCVATVYHYGFGWLAPYPLSSLPVILGSVGGLGMMVGAAALLWLKRRRHASLSDAAQTPMDVAFITLLLAVAITGMVLLAGRSTPAMPLLLCVHLGCVLALFVTLPYGKMVHGAYRFAALLKWAVERRTPLKTVAGE
jgi:citrate/tricarballylate utilization protein